MLAWADLALRTGEMMAASAHVIGHRASRKNTPAQLFEMGNEKWQAAMESSHAMARRWMSLQPPTAPAFLEQWTALLASGLAPFHARALHNARRTARRRARR